METTQHVDHRHVLLGKRPAQVDLRRPLMARYMRALPKAPDECDWTRGRTAWGMLGNEKAGDCTGAMVAHQFGVWTGAARNYWQATESETLAFYGASTGYDPRKPETDNGGVEADVLAYLQQHGFCGWRITGFGRVNLGDVENLRRAMYLLGGACVGASLPISAQNQKLWDVPKGGLVGAGEPNSWGGHAMQAPLYSRKRGVFGFITWGGIQLATEDFVHAYVDEQWALASNAWVGADGKTPAGFSAADFARDVANAA